MSKVKFFQTRKTGLTMMALAVTGLLLVIACNKNEVNPANNDSGSGIVQGPGNGAPSGAHYDLNIIGVANNKTADMTGDNGHRIFVDLVGNTKINLSEGDFQVLDANGTDGTAAFRLPNPDPTNSGTTAYSVYARALGGPGGNAIIHTCGTDVDGITYCSGDSVLLVRSTGHSSFTN